MANDNEPTTFKEALERYIEYRTRFERLENDFDEYQQSSLNYEQELEVQLKQLDSQTHRLQQELFVERTQNEQYRERSEQTIKQFDKRLDQVQEELNACKNLNEKLTTYIRELEQTNDDLERSMQEKKIYKKIFFVKFLLGKRTLLDSLSTFETQLNRALEQNALLENELDEKQQVYKKNFFFLKFHFFFDFYS
jgi:predicted RNase H-like nuclease (RuvC/YqgF family)